MKGRSRPCRSSPPRRYAVITDEASPEETLSEAPQQMPGTGGIRMGPPEGSHDH